MIANLGIGVLMSAIDRQHVEKLVAFVKEWEGKSENRQLRDFAEYLGFFDELDGDIQLEEELSDDAVQLMTVHSAKGLEFPHVFSSCALATTISRRSRARPRLNFRRNS